MSHEIIPKMQIHMSIPEKYVVAYISGYLLRKFCIDNCEACLGIFQQQSLPDSTNLLSFWIDKEQKL